MKPELVVAGSICFIRRIDLPQAKASHRARDLFPSQRLHGGPARWPFPVLPTFYRESVPDYSQKIQILAYSKP